MKNNKTSEKKLRKTVLMKINEKIALKNVPQSVRQHVIQSPTQIQ